MGDYWIFTATEKCNGRTMPNLQIQLPTNRADVFLGFACGAGVPRSQCRGCWNSPADCTNWALCKRGDKQEAASGSLSKFVRLTVPFQNLCWHEIWTATQHHSISVKQMLSITLGCLQAHQPLWGTAMSLCKHYQGLEGP